MTDIEELVRESLRSAPPVIPSSSDPLGAVASRVRRARAWWGGGVAALVAVVVAAVVVPLSLRDSASGGLVPATTVRHGMTVWGHNAVAVTAGGGYLWELRRDGVASDGSGSLVKLDPRTHRQLSRWDVRAPFDFMTFGLGHVWVWGGGDGGYPDGLLQNFDASSSDGCQCNSVGNKDYGYAGVAFLDGHAWVTTGSAIWEMTADAGRVVWSHGFGRGSGPGAVFAVGGRLFVQMSPTTTQQLIPKAHGVGASLGDASAVSDGFEHVLGVEGSDTLLMSTGVDVEQWHAYGTDFRGGNAVFDSGVGQAVVLPNGDVVATTLGEENGSVAPGIWLATAKADGSLCPTCVRRIAAGADVVSLVANPAGSVDFVLDDGTAQHWQP